MAIRIGIGIDFHRLADERRLVIGGVDIPGVRGLVGHSDADVLVHAICDALLGAAALGDIGTHFPPDDPAFKDISSLELLAHVRRRLDEAGWRPLQVDAVVVAEAPRLAPYTAEMCACIAEQSGAPRDHVSVKATTSEGMGSLGRGEGIAAWAVALIGSTAGHPRT